MLRDVRKTAWSFFLGVLLVSVFMVAFDCHDLSLPFTKCSVCELKKTFKGTFKKSLQADLFFDDHSWSDHTFVPIERLPQGHDSPSAGTLDTRPTTNRAPPTLS